MSWVLNLNLRFFSPFSSIFCFVSGIFVVACKMVLYIMWMRFSVIVWWVNVTCGLCGFNLSSDKKSITISFSIRHYTAVALPKRACYFYSFLFFSQFLVSFGLKHPKGSDLIQFSGDFSQIKMTNELNIVVIVFIVFMVYLLVFSSSFGLNSFSFYFLFRLDYDDIVVSFVWLMILLC